MIAYKLLRVRKDGSLGSLFIDCHNRIPVGEWLEAQPHPTVGYAYRPGWHCTTKPFAPHLADTQDTPTGRNRRWHRVELKNVVEIQRPESQGGTWLLAEKMKVLEPVENES